VRLKYAARINATTLPETTAPSYAFGYVDIGAVSDRGTIRLPADVTTFGAAPSRARRLAPPGATVVSTVRTYLRGIARVPASGMPLVFSTGFAVLEPGPEIDPRFLTYACQSDPFVTDVVARSTGVSYPAISPSDLGDIDVPVPPLDEQRRIADLLDGEVERIERIRELRLRQRRLLHERLDLLIDGAVGGEPAAIAGLGCAPDTDGWTERRVGRVCEIRPGFAFSSDGYSRDGYSSDGYSRDGYGSDAFADGGVRLLRGVNVGVGQLDWAEAVGWDPAAHPVPHRFHLRANDLVLAMDRPWIAGGARLAFVTDADLPALLVQRVARLRPLVRLDLRYIRWALGSGRFRAAIEGELTGVSVPHLSADQIGGYPLRLPSPDAQRRIADALDRQADLTRQLDAAIDRQIATLAERRRALITAAIAGAGAITGAAA
jgi:type I restriction enzyme, S subunit